MPRILSLAAERAKNWFYCPDSCPPLKTNPNRQIRSERREACQIILEVLLSRLDLASLCVGIPTLNHGFIDVDMKTIVRDSGLGQRCCKRAIAQLKDAGFIKVKQPRYKNEQGKYFGLRAIRVLTTEFFEWLGLGSMLKKERNRASAALRRKAHSGGKVVNDLMKRISNIFSPIIKKPKRMEQEKIRAWNRFLGDFIRMGIDISEAQRKTNLHFGYPINWSPGQGMPK